MTHGAATAAVTAVIDTGLVGAPVVWTLPGRTAGIVVDLLLGNQPFVDAALGMGSRAVQVLYDRRTQVIPLVIGLREYLQSLTEVIRIPVGDGTLMAGVKAILGSQLCALVPCGRSGTASTSLATGAPAPTTTTTTAPAAARTRPPAPRGNPVTNLLGRVLGA